MYVYFAFSNYEESYITNLIVQHIKSELYSEFYSNANYVDQVSLTLCAYNRIKHKCCTLRLERH